MNSRFHQTKVTDGPRQRNMAARGAGFLLVFVLAGCGGGGGGIGIDEWNTYDKTFDAVATADLNSDGAADVIFSRTTDQFKIKNCDPGDCSTKERSLFDAVVLLQDPLAPGVFLTQPDYALSGKALSVVIDDLDGDSIADITVSQQNDGSADILLQDPALPGAFMERRDVPATGKPVGAASGDLNGDDAADLAVAGEGLMLLLNDPLSPGTVFTPDAPGVDSVTAVAIAATTSRRRPATAWSCCCRIMRQPRRVVLHAMRAMRPAAARAPSPSAT